MKKLILSVVILSFAVLGFSGGSVFSQGGEVTPYEMPSRW